MSGYQTQLTGGPGKRSRLKGQVAGKGMRSVYGHYGAGVLSVDAQVPPPTFLDSSLSNFVLKNIF